MSCFADFFSGSGNADEGHGDRRHAGGHGFEQGVGNAFLARGKDKQVGAAMEFVDVVDFVEESYAVRFLKSGNADSGGPVA